MSFAVGLVWRDGNPEFPHTGLTAQEALVLVAEWDEKYSAHVAPVMLCYDEDDPERGYFDTDRLEEEIECLEYEQHDFTAADIYPDYEPSER